MKMEPIISPIERGVLVKELTTDKFIRETRRGGNYLFEVTAENSPNVMKEIGRLREISFRVAGGGTGKSLDIDEFDIDPVSPYKQLIVWDPKAQEIVGGYRYITCKDIDIHKLATEELFTFSEKFINEYMPKTIELGRSFVQPNYQSTNIKSKSLYSLDNLWDGLGALVLKYSDYEYFFGKVTMYTSYNGKARDTLLNFLNHYFHDNEGLVVPTVPLEYGKDNPNIDELFKDAQYKDGYKILQQQIKSYGEHIPPLINSYMNLSPSMRVFGTSINPGFGGVEETGILINIKDIYPEKIERHTAPLRIWAMRMKNRWWRHKQNKKRY